MDTPSVMSDTWVREFGLAAARTIAGQDAVTDATLRLAADWDGRPAYALSLLVDHTKSRVEPGLLRIRLTLALADELSDRNDDHSIIIEILDTVDWERRKSA